MNHRASVAFIEAISEGHASHIREDCTIVKLLSVQASFPTTKSHSDTRGQCCKMLPYALLEESGRRLLGACRIAMHSYVHRCPASSDQCPNRIEPAWSKTDMRIDQVQPPADADQRRSNVRNGDCGAWNVGEIGNLKRRL